MKAIVKVSDRLTLEIEEPKEMETLNKAITLSTYPKKCSNCQNTDGLYFTSNKDKDGNIYVNIKCPACFARAKLGILKAGGYFWHQDFVVYEPKSSTNQVAGKP